MKSCENANKLRKNATPIETRVWYHLRSRRFMGLKFRRQCPIGPYIVDFICIQKKLIIEIDGSQHAEPKQRQYDISRTRYLENLGYRILRLWNNEVLANFEGVTEQIYKYVFLSHP